MMVDKIATNEVEEAQLFGRLASGLLGAKAKVAALSATERSKIAEATAEAIWS